jgi:small-conductance mechanosensitive channel
VHDAILSVIVTALTVLAVMATRARGLSVRILSEVVLLAAIGGFLLWRGASPIPSPGSLPGGLAGAWLRALAVIWWLIGARLVVNLIVFSRGGESKPREARLFSDLMAAVIYLTAVLIVLNSVLDLNITGLLATSGVVAIILGLALQNTLADVFAGLAVGLDQPFHVGDRIWLGEGFEGVVVQMNWRSIRLRTDGHDLATIPNGIVAKGHIINRSIPTRTQATMVEIVAPSEVPADIVMEIVRQAMLLSPIILSSPAPAVLLSRSGITSSAYAACFFVSDNNEIGAARSALLLQTRRLFRYAGIGRSAAMTPEQILASAALFEAASPDDLRALAGSLRAFSTAPGETIFAQDDVATSLFVVESGVLELSRVNAQGEIETLGRIGPGDYIGELGLITGHPRAFTLTCLTEGRILELQGACLKRVLQSNPSLNVAMEQAVRRGLALVNRYDISSEASPAEGGDILSRIRAFFHV